MDRRTTGIIITLVAVLLCGCPGLIAIFGGGLTAIISQIPGAEIDMFGSNDPSSALTAGLVSVCAGLIGIVIPIVVGIVLLRRKNGGEQQIS